jgi:hypothetical protein
LISGDVITYKSPCGTNCSFTISLPGPLMKCNTTNFNESAKIEDYDGNHVYYLPTYTSGWNTTERGSFPSSLVSGWVKCLSYEWSGACDKDVAPTGGCMVEPCCPATFFVSQHSIPRQQLIINEEVGKQAVNYQRSTQRTSCRLHRRTYTLETEYLNGKRTLKTFTSAHETLEALWDDQRQKPWGHIERIQIDKTSTYQVMNLFGLFESLVQTLSGEMYDGMAVRTPGQAEYNSHCNWIFQKTASTKRYKTLPCLSCTYSDGGAQPPTSHNL